jgi:hypothetical protein
MKHLLFTLVILFAIISCNNKSTGWTASERSRFVSDCTNAAKGGMDESKAKAYCECMQPKIEAKYPSFTEANKISAADLQTETWMAEVKKCLQ